MGLFSKIFKGIKNVVKGVVKGIKNVVKGVGKVVKKIAKSKIFKAILIAAAIYVTGGAAAGAFGSTGAWATSVSNFMASGTFLSTVATPFAKLGTALGTGAGKISDFIGFTTESGRLGAEAITGASSITGGSTVSEISGTQFTGMAPTAAQQAITKETILSEMAAGNFPADAVLTDLGISKGELWKQHAANIATGQGVGPAATTAAATTKSKFVTGLGTWAGKVAGSVTSGYILNELQGEDPAGAMFAGDIEGKRYFDPLTIYGMDGRPLDINSAYESLLYGNIDPFAAKDPLYTQATV
jgi:hypothetical protein